MSGSFIEPCRPDDLVRAVGRDLIELGLVRGLSLFTPEREVWDLPVAQELHRLYNENPDVSADPFLVKLERQLAPGSDEAKQLAAELLTLQGLPLMDVTARKLREDITLVLSWMREPVSVPPTVLAAFGQGSYRVGQGGHNNRWRWLADAVDLVIGWWTLSEAQQASARADPWKWQEAIYRIGGIPMLREELLYLAFPEHFLPIINVADKKAIRAAFAEPGAVPAEVNKDLFDITVRLQREAKTKVDYYRPPFVSQWRKQAERPPGERRAWLVRPGLGGSDLVAAWRGDSFVSLAVTHLGPVSAGASKPEIRAAVAAGYEYVDYAERITLTNEFHAFLSQMTTEDVVVTIVGDRLYLGVLDGQAEYEMADDGAVLRRTAEWLAQSLAVEELPAPLPAELDQPGAVVDLTGALDVLSRLMDGSAEPAEPARPLLPAATDALAARLHIDRSWLQDIIELWRDRSQIILFGPPGTGKTYLARALAGHVADRDAVRLVQFHPSYAYEDFFEGFRPVEDGGGSVGFARVAGPLREIAAKAAADSGRAYVLIVDEINRANLAKVFGELYFLLEYRDATVRLQYSPTEAFNLPPNVFIIGTMNTADRSIALVDAAIRRRFAFIELHPDEAPVIDVLHRWLLANGKPGDDRAELLAALNELIDDEDHDFKIGPSYLMRPNLDTDRALQRVWRHDLMPLLEEHYYGRLTRGQIRDRFGLEAVRHRASKAADLAFEFVDEDSAPGGASQPTGER